MRADYAQLRRYLDHAKESRLLGRYLGRGTGLRGVLATVEECELTLDDETVTVAVVSRKRALQVLKELRTRQMVK